MGQLYDQKRQIGFECMRVIQQLFSGRSAARIAYPDSVARPDDPTSAPRSIGLWDVVRQLEAELERMKHEESQIDIDLEMIKSKGLALGNQAQEYQKYTADGLKTEFKNNYMA